MPTRQHSNGLMMPISLRAMLTLTTIALIATPALAQDLSPLGISLEGYAYPFPVAHHEVDEQGRRLKVAYMDVHPDDANGQTVVLMHGKNFCGAYWERTARDLAGSGFRVVIPDQVGFGKSSKAPDIQYSFHMMARHTASLLDALGVDEANVLGHSMGGMVATRFALMYPDRTKRLVLANPIGLEDWQTKGVPYRPVEAWYQRELGKTPEGIRAYQLDSYYDGKWKRDYEPWVELLARPTLSPQYPTLARVQAKTYDMIFTQPVVHELGSLEMPTLLIIGQRDRTALGKDVVSDEVRRTLGQYPQLGRSAAAAIPDATLIELDGIGHLPHIEAYDRFIRPLQTFLGRE